MNNRLQRFFSLLTLCCLLAPFCQSQEPIIYSNNHYTWYASSMVQQEFQAKAQSKKNIRSNYVSPLMKPESSIITFKYAINGRDNEMSMGKNHTINCLTRNTITPIIRFGQQYCDSSKATYLKDKTKITFRCDLREVLSKFKEQHFYITASGQRINEKDFNGVYVAGNFAPLTWDFDNLYSHTELKMKDDDGDGIYELSLTLHTHPIVNKLEWKQKNDLSAYPVYSTPYPLENAIYQMGLDEMVNAIETDSTLRTGKEWAGVWTRDVSYSIILSMAHLQPEVSKKSLLRKVNKKGRIVQDTGTGGAWPVSSDRMIWATAAMEIYNCTGDQTWLKQVYPIIVNSLEDDYKTVYDPHTELMRGETSFIDWREQSYPRWMQPVDIYNSKCLSTNVVYYNALQVTAQMATILGKTDDAALYSKRAATLKQSIDNYLWQPELHYYAMFLYGRNNNIVLDKSETLGESLAILFDVADEKQAYEISEHIPLTPYGVPVFYPQIVDMPPYHNNAIWPFVSSYLALACAKVNNEAGVLFNMASIYRAAALFATNKENMVAENGDYMGTQVNSDNMLWSLSGNLALVHKLLFGMHFTADSLTFKPFVPQALAGTRTLDHFTYRDALLHITLEGCGNQIACFTLDNKATTPSIPGNLKGEHTIYIKLERDSNHTSTINLVENAATPLTPIVHLNDHRLTIDSTELVDSFNIMINGINWLWTTQHAIDLPYYLNGEIQVEAVKSRYHSFASEPIDYQIAIQSYEVEEFATPSEIESTDFKGQGYVLTDVKDQINTSITIDVQIATDGYYLLKWRYANGNGPINTDNKCCIRTMQIDDSWQGAVVMPQRGVNEWSNWGWSNSNRLFLKEGLHHVTLKYEPENENMNGQANSALIDQLLIEHYETPSTSNL